MQLTSIDEELMALERKYWQALKDEDAETVARLSDDPCLITGAYGVGQLDRATLSTMVRDAAYKLDAFLLINPVVRRITDDVAVLAYQVYEELTVNGTALTLDAADSSTWVRRDGRWLCAVHTESINGPPLVRARQAGATVTANPPAPRA